MTEERVKIRLKVAGIELEIECTPSEVEEAVKKALKGIKSVTEFKEVLPVKQTGGLRPTTCKGMIEELWKEGWFKEPRSLGEVWEEIARRGYNYDRSAVAHALLDLTREGKITRRGKARKYVYVQKVPYMITQ